jgi:3-oxoacid CoA-transferase
MQRIFASQERQFLARRAFSSKVFPNAAAATKDIKDGMTLCIGGFGVCGVPSGLIGALQA